MSSNTSPLLVATTTTEEIPHVILNTSPHGGDPALSSGQTSPIFRPSPAIPQYQRRHTNDHLNGTLETQVLPVYQRSLFSRILTSFTIHFLFPFLNGVMLGFGEICANELAFRMGWFAARNIPLHSRSEIPLGLKEQFGAGLFTKSKRKRGENEKAGNGDKQMGYTEVAPIS